MVEIGIGGEAWPDGVADERVMVRAAALAALDGAGKRPAAAASDSASGLVAILLTDDEAVADLNAEYRRKAGPTNVLSFPAAQNPEGFLGDLALAFGVCAREADQQNKSLADHLQHLVAHGVLHLVGYDHMNEDEAADMEGLERRILAGLGVADPYAAEQGDHD